MFDNKIHLGLQIVPTDTKLHPYSVIDEAIKVIQESGLKHKVCPMETVIEGYYDEIMPVVKQAIAKAYELSNKVYVNIRIELIKGKDISMEEKLEKYE